MKTRYFILLAATVLFASCAKELQDSSEILPEGISETETVLEVGIDATKTYMGDLVGNTRKVYWSNGDQVALNGVASAALEELPAGTLVATFKWAGEIPAPYNLLYPASIYKDASTVTLPAVQTYKAGGFADGVMPMAGYSADGSSLSVSHLCAIVKVSVLRSSAQGADEDNLVSARFKGRNNEKVSGDFSIDYTAPALAAADGTGAELEVKVVKSQATSTSDAAVYYIVVPARTYSNGFDVTVVDKNGHYMVQSKTASANLEAGHIYDLPEFAFVPTGTELGIEISSAQQLIDFAKAYNNKEYLEDVIATVTADIAFDATTSAAFNETGGIGTKYGGDNYFNGIIDGKSHTISGLEATCPIFAGMGDGGTVKNLTFDNTCSFTFTHDNSAEGMFASIVGYHKGLLENINVAADITLAEKTDVTKMTTIGGLTGRTTVGSLKNCTYSGLISTPAGFTSNNKLIIGGLVGRFSNTGSVSDSYFKGAISNAAQITSTDKNNPYLIIGGIAGHVDGGASISSTNTTADHAVVDGAYSGSSGIIVNKTTTAYHSSVGGIIGELNNGTVSSCTNASTILITIIRSTDVDTQARYVKTGGIVGKNNASGTVNGCTNNAAILHYSNPRLQEAGGIVGYNAGTVTGNQSVNNGNITFGTTGVDPIYGARVPYLGGIIGENVSSNVSNVQNNGNLNLSRTEMGSTGFRIAMGGVIAYNTAAIDGGASKNIVNTGKVEFATNINKQTTDDGYLLGGVMGYSSASVQNVKNSGYVLFTWSHTSRVAQKVYLGGVVGLMDKTSTVSGCVNKGGESNAGEVYLNFANGALHTGVCVGGIIGGNKAASAITISQCENSGYVHTSNYTAADKSLYVGGIAGSLVGSSSISSCSNSGQVFLNASNNTDDDVTKIFAEGGIVGFAQGTSENRITISDCEWTYTTKDIGARRGTCGGVAGYAEYTNISDSDVEVNYNMYNHVTGGIVGWAVNSAITGCKFKGTKITASQGFWSAGVVAKLTAGSVIDGCYNYCKDITAPKAATVRGEIAAISEAGTTIKNCHHTGTISICSDTNFTDDGSNVADL